MLAFPLNLWPDVFVDNKNDRVVVTFPPSPPNEYMGMVHPSVKLALHKAEFKKQYFELNVYFPETIGYVVIIIVWIFGLNLIHIKQACLINAVLIYREQRIGRGKSRPTHQLLDDHSRQ